MRHEEGTYGRLPEMAPLANPYVPFQLENPPRYDPGKGLIRGTIYPGLDLPFQGKVNQREFPQTPRVQLQTLSFALQELALYLDTHPEDEEALKLYREYQKLYAAANAEYSRTHSPMTHTMPVEHPTYTWLDEPWPWEFAANKEG